MKTLYLIGFMGAGKTTIGKALGERLVCRVIDTDEEIVIETKMTINEIFTAYGESYFRNLESDMLSSLPTKDVIVTTGGGIILNEKNRRWMKDKGKVIFLYCDPIEVVRRLKNDRTRPLLKENKAAEIHQLFEKRRPLYEETAHFIVDTTNKTVDEIVDQIEGYLHR